jgi:hypothetical protein
MTRACSCRKETIRKVNIRMNLKEKGVNMKCDLIWLRRRILESFVNAV